MSHIEQLNTLLWHEFAHLFLQNYINFKYFLYSAASHTLSVTLLVWHWPLLFWFGPCNAPAQCGPHLSLWESWRSCDRTPCQISGKEQGSPHWQMESGALLWLCFGCLVHAHGEATESLKQHKAQLCQHNTASSVQHSNSALPGKHYHHKNNLGKALALNHMNKPRARNTKLLLCSPLLGICSVWMKEGAKHRPPIPELAPKPLSLLT